MSMCSGLSRAEREELTGKMMSAYHKYSRAMLALRSVPLQERDSRHGRGTMEATTRARAEVMDIILHDLQPIPA